jgi:phosphoribosylaminoimidazole-succinocarboxamide synthase
MQHGEILYQGKTKSLYRMDDPKQLLVEFRDDATAFDGTKHERLADKGAVNNQFNAFIMQHLADNGVANHFIEQVSPNESLVKHLEMLPIECVVRNVATGSLCRRLGVEEGIQLSPPLFEFFLKNDELHDPMINQYHITGFGWATADEVKQMTELTFKVNDILKPLFADAGMILVDYKLEFGRYDGQLLLGDEFTPDGCRIWDSETNEKLDKDRFRKDLGDVIQSYQIAADRLGIPITL